MVFKEYTFVNPETGEKMGPPQRFEAENWELLADKLATAHQNATIAYYRSRDQVRFERVLNPDQGRPIRQFTPRQLTADERVKIANLRKDPATASEATRLEMEALLGGSLDDVLGQLNEAESERIARIAQEGIDEFLAENPRYIVCDTNKDAMERELLKHGWPVTKRNLQIVFDTLSANEKIALRPEPTAAPASTEIPSTTGSSEPASSSQPPISGSSPAPRAASTSLSSRDSIAPQQPVPVKEHVEFTPRYINSLSAADFAKHLSNPEFVKAVDAMKPRG